MKYKLILFDYDFTLADCSNAIVECFNRSFHDMGLDTPDSEAVRRTIGMTLPNAYTYLTGDNDEDNRTACFNNFKIHADQIMNSMSEFIGNADKTVKKLHDKGYKLGIVTTKLRYRITDFLKLRQLDDIFSIILGIDSVEHPKPAPDGILKAASDLNIDISDILYVGDNEIDGQAAENAGVDFLAVLTGTTPIDALKKYTDKIADSVDDIELFL